MQPLSNEDADFRKISAENYPPSSLRFSKNFLKNYNQIFSTFCKRLTIFSVAFNTKNPDYLRPKKIMALLPLAKVYEDHDNSSRMQHPQQVSPYPPHVEQDSLAKENPLAFLLTFDGRPYRHYHSSLPP